jgi:hypothetical protein
MIIKILSRVSTLLNKIGSDRTDGISTRIAGRGELE